jgi:Zn finger protein HypA/HybF involved in hydrogenase expression
MECPCNNCPQMLEFEPNQVGQAVKCPTCGLDTILFASANLPVFQEPQHLPPPAPIEVIPSVATARLRLARKTSLGGVAMELVGFVLLFLFPIGTIIGICFLIVGFNASKVWRCSNCMNLVADRKVRICPSCGASIR